MLSAVGLALIFYAGYLFLKGEKATKYNCLHLRPKTKQPRIAVLVAARDESRVIEDLLKSLLRQTVPVKAEDIYVIVESLDDPTVKICARHHVSVIVRKHAKARQRKGYALDEAVKQILAKKQHYDIYFVFDADNIVTKDYVAEMLPIYYQGYEMATGYRGAKNGDANLIAAVSSLTFTMVNVMSNRRRTQRNANIVFSGTGFYVAGSLVEEWRGWPFHSLTEDYEMSLWATLHGVPTHYNEAAVFYDEQPTSYHQTVLQRVRWIKGYFAVRHKYIPLIRARKRSANYGSLIKERIGVRPAILTIVGLILIIVGTIVELCVLGHANKIWLLLILILAGVYIVLALITLELLKRERLELPFKMALGVILFNPLYLVTYIPCAIQALVKQNVTWARIEHGKPKKS